MDSHYSTNTASPVVGYINNSSSNPSCVSKRTLPFDEGMVGYGTNLGIVNNTTESYWVITRAAPPFMLDSKRKSADFNGRVGAINTSPHAIRIFKVFNIPYKRVKDYREVKKNNQFSSPEELAARYPDAAALEEYLTKHDLEFSNMLIKTDEDTGDQYMVYEEFTDVDMANIRKPTYLKGYDLALVPGSTPYKDLPPHPSKLHQRTVNPEDIGHRGVRKITVFDPFDELPFDRVYLPEYNIVQTLIAKKETYQNKAGVLVEYERTSNSEVDPGSKTTMFFSLDEVVVRLGGDADDQPEKGPYRFYNSYKEAKTSMDLPAVKTAYAEKLKADAEKELTEVKQAMALREQEIKERELGLKSTYTEKEYATKIKKSDSESLKATLQLAGAFALITTAAIKWIS